MRCKRVLYSTCTHVSQYHGFRKSLFTAKFLLGQARDGSGTVSAGVDSKHGALASMVMSKYEPVSYLPKALGGLGGVLHGFARVAVMVYRNFSGRRLGTVFFAFRDHALVPPSSVLRLPWRSGSTGRRVRPVKSPPMTVRGCAALPSCATGILRAARVRRDS
jgi:hypothetical protein